MLVMIMKKKSFLICLLVFFDVQAFHFYQSVETLSKITEIITKQEKGIYLRFGDGDVVLANGQNDSNQQWNADLQKEMREAFAFNGSNVLKCLPLGCRELGGFEEGMFPGNHEQSYEWCVDILHLASGIWNGEMKDIYSMTALAHCATNRLNVCLEFLKFLKHSGCAVLVGNCNIPAYVRELLFGSDCQFVPTPAQNSYLEIDRIEKDCCGIIQKVPGYKVIVTSMGCSGRVLQKRLWHKFDDIFLFDFGSLMDAICGWDTREWIHVLHFDHHQFLRILEKELMPNRINNF